VADPLDERILAALHGDGRADGPAVAAAVDAPIQTVRDRIDALEADATIRGYTAKLDHETLGHVTAVLRLRVGHETVATVVERLRTVPWVVSLYETTGRHPVVAVGRFVDEDALAACVTELHHDPDVDGVAAARVERVACERDSPLGGN